jgi:hypothetical protein
MTRLRPTQAACVWWHYIPIEPFTFAKSFRFLDNSTPALIDQVGEKRKLSGDPAGSRGSVKDVGAAHTSTKENQTLRYASEDLSAHVSISRHTAK